MKHNVLKLTGFGQEFDKYEYKNSLDWIIRFNDADNLWRAQPTYLLVQAAFLLGGLLTFLHATNKGGRWPWLWLTATLHGMVVEVISYFVPDIDNFWHSQTPVILFGGRLPLYIIFVYPVFIYNAAYAVSKLQLPKWAEPFAVGLTVVLIDMPYEIIAVKFVHWTWHDTDPNVFDRHYGVPWNLYYFFGAMSASVIFCFQKLSKIFGNKKEEWESSGFIKEFSICIMTALLGMSGGALLFQPLYHPLHDIGKVHAEVTFFILFVVFLTIAWTGDRTARKIVNQKVSQFDYVLVAYLSMYYSLFLAISVWGHPENEVSMGLHQTVGPCENRVPVQNVLGLDIDKGEFLCVTEYNEEFFDFHCLPNGRLPKNGSVWYTICGKPFRNRIEYIAIMGLIGFAASMIFFNFYFISPIGSKKFEKDQISSSKQKKVQ